jgi:hypothetical protein
MDVDDDGDGEDRETNREDKRAARQAATRIREYG